LKEKTMPYTADHPARRESDDELRARIPGWGADADHANRPSVPKERFDPDATGAHWEFPERQQPAGYRERSIEHEFLTPVFGTTAPLKGFSGAIRRYAYERFSEGRAAHWLLLLASDRVDTIESRVASVLARHPDNPIAETGIGAEIKYHGFRSRVGRNRADVRHVWMDPFVVAGPGIVLGVVLVRWVRGSGRKRR
jgi:hypothetical protein